MSRIEQYVVQAPPPPPLKLVTDELPLYVQIYY